MAPLPSTQPRSAALAVVPRVSQGRLAAPLSFDNQVLTAPDPGRPAAVASARALSALTKARTPEQRSFREAHGAAFGDWLWDVLVVQFAAWLDRLTLRKIIAFIPLVILVLAYMHRIPTPPELMLVGDLLAYIDVFAMIFLLGMIARVEMVVYVLKRAIDLTIAGAGGVLSSLRRLDFRHGRAGGESGRRKRGQCPHPQCSPEADETRRCRRCDAAR